MYITLQSKKLITAIAAVTFVAVGFSGFLFTENVSQPEKLAKTVKEKQLENDDGNSILVNSMTNTTKMVNFGLSQEQSFTGYIRGVGYASFEFYAQANQRIKATLGSDQAKSLELILFGNTETQVIDSGQELVVPSSGFYELRVLFRNNIEIEEEKEMQIKKSVPTPYHLTLQLSFGDSQVLPAN